jgi:hypothetical protein
VFSSANGSLCSLGWEGVDWINLAQIRDQSQNPENAVMNFLIR